MTYFTQQLIATIGALFVFASAAFAAGPQVVMVPAVATVSSGENIDVSVTVDPQGSTVYAVEGTLVLSGAICERVEVAPDLVAQTSPTCASPYFLIGVPGGTSANRSLVTVTLKRIASGEMRVGLSTVDIIGEGVSLGNAAQGGVYTVKRGAGVVATTTVPPSESVTGEGEGVLVSTSSIATTVSTEEAGKGKLLAAVLGALDRIPLGVFGLIALALVVLAAGMWLRRSEQDEQSDEQNETKTK